MEPNMTNNERDDELLSAMLDGELDDAAADALTERLAREPLLARRLERLRSSDDAARALFAKVDELPMPQSVLDLLAADDSSAAAATDNVIPFPQRVIARFANAPVAIAASVALAAGFFVNQLLDESPPAPTGIAALQAQSVPPDSAIHSLLEESASGKPLSLEDGTQAQILLTFVDQNGDWCRQLSLENVATSVAALSCRRNGRWQNEVLAFGEPANGSYQQAAAGTLAIIGGAIDRMIGDEAPLETAEEQKVLEKQWTKD